MPKTKTIQDLLLMTEGQCFGYLASILPAPTVSKGNYIYQPGSPLSTVMLVAHMDTVSNPQHKHQLVTSPSGLVITTDGSCCLGADDRAGVWAMVEIFNRTLPVHKPHLLFTCKEECGGIGASEFVKNKSLIAHLSKTLHLMIELDRRGASEWVTYDETLEAPLKGWIEGFGFTEESGSYSDIATIGPVVKVPSANLSVGYYSQHTHKEKLHIDEMRMTVSRVLAMLADPPPDTAYVECRPYGMLGRHWRDFDDYTVGGIKYESSCDIVEGLIGKDGLCDECDEPWMLCECGYMADIIEEYLTEDEIEDLYGEIPHAPVIQTLTWDMSHKKGVRV